MSVVSEKVIADLRLGLESLEVEHAKFEKGNKVAGTRARNVLQEMKVLAQELRVDIQEAKSKK